MSPGRSSNMSCGILWLSQALELLGEVGRKMGCHGIQMDLSTPSQSSERPGGHARKQSFSPRATGVP